MHFILIFCEASNSVSQSPGVGWCHHGHLELPSHCGIPRRVALSIWWRDGVAWQGGSKNLVRNKHHFYEGTGRMYHNELDDTKQSSVQCTRKNCYVCFPFRSWIDEGSSFTFFSGSRDLSTERFESMKQQAPLTPTRPGLKDVVGTLCWCPEIHVRRLGTASLSEMQKTHIQVFWFLLDTYKEFESCTLSPIIMEKW